MPPLPTLEKKKKKVYFTPTAVNIYGEIFLLSLTANLTTLHFTKKKKKVKNDCSMTAGAFTLDTTKQNTLVISSMLLMLL